VFLALVIQHAKLMRHIVICGLFGSTLFFTHYVTNDTIFEKKILLYTKSVFWFHLQILPKFWFYLQILIPSINFDQIFILSTNFAQIFILSTNFALILIIFTNFDSIYKFSPNFDYIYKFWFRV